LVENLSEGSAALRGQLPKLLDKCELLMKVGEEYRIQTEESTAWMDEFQSQRSALANESHRIEAERDDRIRKRFSSVMGKITLLQGKSKVTREVSPVFDSQLPSDSASRICVWVRDGWSSDENSVRADARQAGNSSSTIFVFIPKRSADDLRHHLIDSKAARATLDKRGAPNTPEGSEARAAMETTFQTSESKLGELLSDAFSGARVYQGGGNEIIGKDLQQMIHESAENALQRLYPKFQMADHIGWSKVYEKAQKGAPDALKAVGDEGEPDKNQVCKEILSFIAGGKKGCDIRSHFEANNYGWSRDAVDGALQVLLIAGLVRSQDERGQVVDPKEIERKSIGKFIFKMEATTVTTAQRIQIRKLYQKVGLSSVKSGEELAESTNFLQKMFELAEQAGGEAPKPEKPNTSRLDDIRRLAGNERLLALYNSKEEIADNISEWKKHAEVIAKKWPDWLTLSQLAHHAEGIKDAQVLLSQIEQLCKNRLLLEEPDVIRPILISLTQILRQELGKLKSSYDQKTEAGEARLEADENWVKLEVEQRYALRKPHQLIEAAAPVLELENSENVLKTLNGISLSALRDRVAAIDGRFEQVILDAAKLLEPKAQEVRLGSRTLKTESEVDDWLSEVRAELLTKLKDGPVLPR
nr:BREX system P-loop protein BrxC [Desulfobulbaceae bacterium]